MLIRFATVSAFAALLAATAAQAAPVPVIAVQIAGRSPTQIHHDILAAATRSCAIAQEDVSAEYDSQEDCETETVAAAYKKIASYAAASDDVHLAMLVPAQDH